MSLSISLYGVNKLVADLDLMKSGRMEKVNMIVPVTAFDIVIIATCHYTISTCSVSAASSFHTRADAANHV